MLNRLTGTLLLAISLGALVAEWSGSRAIYLAAGLGVVLFLALAAGRVPKARLPFLAVSLGLAGWAYLARPDGLALIERGLLSSGFIVGFFVALAWLRHAAGGSPAIQRCGRYLAEQPPGRRYAALTMGGHLFGLVLSYGAIALLGSLAEASAAREPNREIAEIRARRMLLAVQRGFISTLPWSPLAFAVAISVSLVPGASWAAAAPYCAVSSFLLIALGWVVDTIVKPKLKGPRPPPQTSEGDWRRLSPLIALLIVLVGTVGVLQALTGLRTIAVVMAVVPVVSLGWIGFQGRGLAGGALGHLAARVARFAADDLTGYRSELVLLATAGFIGTVGAALLQPLIAATGFDIASLPGWSVMLALVFIIPVTGQLGMNPILAVSLLAPLLPSAAALGLEPAALIVAITAGWALSGITSPYTATTLLVGSFGHVSARRVGLVWNGIYVAVVTTALGLWVVTVALI